MEATAQLLKEKPYSDVRITDVARGADIAQPNFYTYFASLEDVIIALAEEVSTSPLAQFIALREIGMDWAAAMVETAIPIWREHRTLFAIIGMLADKQHGDFPRLRVQQTRDVCKAFEGLIRRAQEDGELPLSIKPRLGSYLCLGVLSSTCDRYDLWRASGFTHEELVETTASMLRILATGRG
jgi:AcrR family transcriptional regulator